MISCNRAVGLGTSGRLHHTVCTCEQASSSGRIFFPSQYTDTNMCPAIIRSLKQKQTNKKWTCKIQKHVFKLNVAKLMVLKNQLLQFARLCDTAYGHGLLPSYSFGVMRNKLKDYTECLESEEDHERARSIRVSSNPAEIQTRYYPNTSLDHYHYISWLSKSSLLSFCMKENLRQLVLEVVIKLHNSSMNELFKLHLHGTCKMP
jgi:hypothetical protein